MNYNMHGMNKTLVELFAMLKVAEKDIQKTATNHVLMVNKTTHFKKKKSGGNKKKADKTKGKAPKAPKAGKAAAPPSENGSAPAKQAAPIGSSAADGSKGRAAALARQ